MGETATKVLKAIGIVLAFLLALVLIFFIAGSCTKGAAEADEGLSSWMSRVKDDAPLNKIAIPGSHDAGTAGVCWLGQTQNVGIAKQLSCGARYFDIRVRKTDDRLVIFHDVLNGADFKGVLSDIKGFLTEHPTETLLLDFQHFSGDSQREVYDLLKDELFDEGLIVRNMTSLDDVQFIRQLTLGDVRGKCIVFWGDRSEDFSDWLFLRNDDECTQDGMSLDSYYIGSIHKDSTEALIEEGYPVYFAKLAERQAAEQDAIFVLQAQLTDGKLVFGPWQRERSNDPVISDYIRTLRNNEMLGSINVILRDFLDPVKCSDIIELNAAKGIMD